MPDAYCLTSENVVSLCTAIFRDDGYVATLHLMSRHKGEANMLGWVYRRRLPLLKQFKRKLFHRDLAKVESYLRTEVMPERPEVGFIWSDDGLSVGVLIGKVPWAFIHKTSQKGYSKSVCNLIAGNFWDEELYQKIFR